VHDGSSVHDNSSERDDSPTSEYNNSPDYHDSHKIKDNIRSRLSVKLANIKTEGRQHQRECILSGRVMINLISGAHIYKLHYPAKSLDDEDNRVIINPMQRRCKAVLGRVHVLDEDNEAEMKLRLEDSPGESDSRNNSNYYIFGISN